MAICVGLGFGAYTLWQSGLVVRDGRNNRNQNAMWIGHGWLGGDSWFEENKRRKEDFRTRAHLQNLVKLCAQNGISDIYPHLCPASKEGSIPEWDDKQVERLLDATPKLRVLPWIGGRLDGDSQIDSPQWRAKFVASALKLVRAHPRLAGVHLNFEPWVSENTSMLAMLDELRKALPDGKLISVSAYPPRDFFYPFRRGWSEDHFSQVAKRCDQMVLMSYDSSAQQIKLYQWFMARWTRSSLELAASAPRPPQILMGVPTYDDVSTPAGLKYHNSQVESPENAILGIHQGLSKWQKPPAHFQGIAIYSEWVTDEDEWRSIRRDWN